MGKYLEVAGRAETDCKTCPSSAVTLTAARTAANDCLCVAGYTLDAAGNCTECVAGTYKESVGDGVCTLCSAGTYSEHVGMKFSSNCSGCGVGKYSNVRGLANASKCEPCSAGYSTQGETHMSKCTACEPGKYAEAPGAGTCDPCPLSTYSTSTGASNQTTCLTCEPGSKSFSTGASTSDVCVDDCPAGYTGNISDCTLCAVTSACFVRVARALLTRASFTNCRSARAMAGGQIQECPRQRGMHRLSPKFDQRQGKLCM